MVWNEDHYYVVGFSEKHQKITTFRVDRMKKVNILSADAVEKPDDFSLPDFTCQVFDMYDGTKERVTLICKNDMMNYIIDRFGDEVETSPTDYGHFKAVAEVSVSQTFFAWVFQFNGEIKITRPASVVTKYKKMLESALEQGNAGYHKKRVGRKNAQPVFTFIKSIDSEHEFEYNMNTVFAKQRI